MTRTETFSSVSCLIGALVLASGCASTCDPVCCAECPPKIERVEVPPEVVMVMPPAAIVPDEPELSSVSEYGLEIATDDPVQWFRLVAEDLARMVEAFRGARDELVRYNESAEVPDGG
jgi:hypothetical protein